MKTQKFKYHVDASFWRPFLDAGLTEDQGIWDWSAHATSKKTIKSKLIAKESGVWVGTGMIDWLSIQANQNGQTFKSKCLVNEGEEFKRGEILATFEGPTHLILGYERPTINIVSFASGIAKQTQILVKIVQKACVEKKLQSIPRVTGTRKTLPFYRDLSIHSIIVGGGYSHRTSLSGGVLLKENHIAAAGSISKAIENARKIAPHTLKIETEVRNLKELKEACLAKSDIVMLDNFSPSQVETAMSAIENLKHHPLIEVSGGINESSIESYVIKGVDIISVGSLTHSVKSCDLSWLVI